MQDSTFQALIARALHEATPAPEATASMGRILASAEARKRLANMLDGKEGAAAAGQAYEELRRRYVENRATLERAVREIERLRASQRPQDNGQQQSSTNGAPKTNGTGRAYKRRPKPVVELEAEATCADCGADLFPGDRARVYPGGRIYGTDCHGRR